MKGKVLLTLLLAATLTLTACGGSNKETPPEEQEVEQTQEEPEEVKEPIEVEKVETEDERLALIQDYLTMLYYRNDAYDDYVELYANEEDAVGEDTFDSFRQGSSLENSFGTEDIGTIMETMKVEETSDTEATVYWVEEENQGLEEAKQSWKVVKQEDEWKLAE